ncbi:hypothetical protein M422DRAFT_243627 [Sphaerobolus stellatus SS14]|nr:hypothetical protein M422DRAFT_243627 [Sphaerobolus stellatus SS14]
MVRTASHTVFEVIYTTAFPELTLYSLKPDGDISLLCTNLPLFAGYAPKLSYTHWNYENYPPLSSNPWKDITSLYFEVAVIMGPKDEWQDLLLILSLNPNLETLVMGLPARQEAFFSSLISLLSLRKVLFHVESL